MQAAVTNGCLLPLVSTESSSQGMSVCSDCCGICKSRLILKYRVVPILGHLLRNVCRSGLRTVCRMSGFGATIMVQQNGLWCNQIFQSAWLQSLHCGWATGLHLENSKKENTKSKEKPSEGLRLTSRTQSNWSLLATCSIAMKANKNDLSK